MPIYDEYFLLFASSKKLVREKSLTLTLTLKAISMNSVNFDTVLRPIHKHFCEQLRSRIAKMVTGDPSASVLSREDVIACATKIRNQSFIRACTFNMRRSLIVCGIVLTLLVTDALAVEGVKGGHRAHQGGKGGRLNQIGAVNSTVQAGLCYKTVPYADALALNSTGQFPHNTLPSTNGNEETNGWITILDCCNGYERNLTSGSCDPRCNEGCLGGKCTAPNVCACPEGWFPQNGVCMPYCERPCQQNAYCFSPNVCACILRYEEVNGVCRPICPRGCINGKCVAPNVCDCEPGYLLEGNKCVPNCPQGCANGECMAPGLCKCNTGFATDYTGKCAPLEELSNIRSECPNGCGANGTCAGPNRCACDLGYRVDPDTGRCIPSPTSFQCRNGCGAQGVCVGPNLCICNYGMEVDPDTGRCPDPRPLPPTPGQCPNGCEPNAMCIATSNRCICKLGFIRDPNTGTCVRNMGQQTSEPLCENYCFNGMCTGLNECTCKPGYTMDPIDPSRSRCLPVCRNGCVNGICTAPNLCLCNPGYTKETGVKGRQRCVPIV